MSSEILVCASLKLAIGRELAASLSELLTKELASLVARQDDFGSNAGSHIDLSSSLSIDVVRAAPVWTHPLAWLACINNIAQVSDV
jgi:hypothetical protein